ncbi:unnamed protein product [Effrenium voratum]|uniref:Uncharacterized protein n=1 Tax=Effrenium voratum TaxID=2562239 RepID=A0AA36NEV2_9DINO|nr:unnamed protein product [Effrenium voratum]
MRRGPATNIRDSLTGPVLARRTESPAPEERRSSSLDPPRGPPRRNESPVRGDVRGRYPATQSPSPSFGFNLGMRATTPAPAPAPSAAQRGMGAFRGSRGPVRAKADVLLDSARPGRRPSTAPPPAPARSSSVRRPVGAPDGSSQLELLD